jgi:drug efflux transport system permease protein
MSMAPRRVVEMVRKEFRQMFRDPRMKPIVFVSPVIQLLLFGYAVNTDVRHTSTFVVDQDATAESRAMLDALTASGHFTITGRSHRPADLVTALDRGDAVVGVQIPAGFASDLKSGRANVQVIVDGTNSNTGTIARANAVQIIAHFAQRGAQASGRIPTGIDLRMRAWYNPALVSRVYNVPGVIGLLLLIMCLLLTALAVVREREIGTLDQLLVTPLQPAELMLGKTIPVAVIGLIDLALISGVAILWFHIPFRGSLLALLPAALIYIVAGLSLGLIISSMARTQQEAFMTMFLFALPAIILSGFLYPVSSMPRILQWLTLLNPVRHFIEIVRAVFLKGAGFMALWPQYITLTGMAIGGLWIATVRFKRSVR